MTRGSTAEEDPAPLEFVPTLPNRHEVFGGEDLPDAGELVAEGRDLARTVSVGSCPFLREFGVASEADYKRRCVQSGRLMLHGQIGYRSLEKSRRCRWT